MLFRTELKVDKAPFQIDHSMKIVSIGSCFANMIGDKLEKSKFSISTNPFGIIFNPISQCTLFDLSESLADPRNYFFRDGMVFNYHLHSEHFASSINQFRENIGSLSINFNRVVENADVIIFTFGTAMVYRHLEADLYVANCHKAPSAFFKKETLDVDYIVSSFINLIQNLRRANPGLKIILTVSPVRHIKDTIVLNSLSKAILRNACHKIAEVVKDTLYFPSFELMMDDLRDYRFYKEDMIHPTTFAEEYIWNKFTECYFSETTTTVIKDLEKVKKAIEHNAFQPNSEANIKFIKLAIDQTKMLERYFNVENELNLLQKKLLQNQ